VEYFSTRPPAVSLAENESCVLLPSASCKRFKNHPCTQGPALSNEQVEFEEWFQLAYLCLVLLSDSDIERRVLGTDL